MQTRRSRQERAASIGRAQPCPPHGPMMVAAVERRAYIARSLRCGLSDPAREDGVDAKRVFDEALEEER